MKIKIYQINSERDADRAKFMGLGQLKDNVDPSSYDEVFSGDVDCNNLEDLFTRFNTGGHPLHRGHSLSVSDVVLTENGAFFCDAIGFKEIAGPFFIVGEDGEGFRSLTDEEAQRYMEHFAEPEQISQQEVQEDTGFAMHFF